MDINTASSTVDSDLCLINNSYVSSLTYTETRQSSLFKNNMVYCKVLIHGKSSDKMSVHKTLFQI